LVEFLLNKCWTSRNHLDFLLLYLFYCLRCLFTECFHLFKRLYSYRTAAFRKDFVNLIISCFLFCQLLRLCSKGSNRNDEFLCWINLSIRFDSFPEIVIITV